MKSFFLSTNFLISVFLSLPLMLCSSDDDGGTPETPDTGFTPVTLDLSTVTIDETETSFEVEGFQFTNSLGSTSMNGVVEGIQLARADENGNPSFIDLDLEGVEDMSQITVSAIDNGGGTGIALRNNGTTVTGQNVSSGTNEAVDTVFDVSDLTIDTVRIFSFEGFVLSITLE